MSLESRIIEFLDSDELRIAYVRKQERDRLHVVDPRGRNLSVNSDRVVIVHRTADEGNFPAIARQISEKITARQSEVDVELLWQSVGNAHRELESGELAELFFAEGSSEAASAIFRALSTDTLFFKRKGAQFQARTEEQVSAERTRRQRHEEHEHFRKLATTIITQLLRKNDGAVPPYAEAIISRIHNWLRHRTVDEVGLLLEETVGVAKARDAAYEILRHAGKVDPALDRFLVMAGVDADFSPALKSAAEHLAPHKHTSDRADFQHLPAFTIDDEDTREIDDALTL